MIHAYCYDTWIDFLLFALLSGLQIAIIRTINLSLRQSHFAMERVCKLKLICSSFSSHENYPNRSSNALR